MPRLLGLVAILCILPSALSDTFDVKQGGAFVHSIDIEDGELKSCVLNLTDEKIDLYPNRIQDAKDEIKTKIISLENRACGFILNDFQPKNADDYELTAKVSLGGKQITLTKVLKVQLKNTKVQLKNATGLMSYGEDYDVKSCTIPYEVFNARNRNGRIGVTRNTQGFCSLYSPKGELVDQGTSCHYTIRFVRQEHVGDWKCEINIPGEVTPTAYFINLRIKESARVETWYKKQDGYGIVGCKYIPGELGPDDREWIVDSCTMLTPTKQFLYVEPNAANGRYAASRTNYTKNICQIEFKLPADEREIGTWTCQLANTQGFVVVERASHYPKAMKILTAPGKSPEVTCEVPYPAVNSFVVNPTGQVHYRAKYSDSQKGMLSFYIHDIKESDFGEWTCHFAKNNSYEDDVISVNVERFDMVKPRLKEVDVDEGDELVILFTANGAISYCAIEDPRGNTYHIRRNTDTPYLEYYGRGFELGDCGLKIKHASALHEGLWKCMTNTLATTSGDSQATARTKVGVQTREEAGIASASSSSILIGIVFAVMVATASVIYVKFRKERKERVSPRNSLGDENSERTYVLRHL